jgi:hypothetical protein
MMSIAFGIFDEFFQPALAQKAKQPCRQTKPANGHRGPDNEQMYPGNPNERAKQCRRGSWSGNKLVAAPGKSCLRDPRLKRVFFLSFFAELLKRLRDLFAAVCGIRLTINAVCGPGDRSAACRFSALMSPER